MTPRRELDGVLLTGATGFLGFHLLGELLSRTSDRRVRALVRAATVEEGRARLRDAQRRFQLEVPLDLDRVEIVCGDLALPGLGLEEDARGALLEGIGEIAHVGALVNAVYPYRALRATNVLAVQELITLAARSGARLHFVSSASVFHPGRDACVSPDSPIDTPETLRGMGYPQTKSVAEVLLRRAAEVGLEVVIHRPVRIAWHSRSGAWLENDFLARVLEASVHLGAAPELDMMQELVAVEDVAGGLAEVLLNPAPSPLVHHWAADVPVAFKTLVGWLEGSGLVMRRLPLEDWRRALLQVGLEEGRHAFIILANASAALASPFTLSLTSPRPFPRPEQGGFTRWLSELS